mgnify:CR=1 FL=1
MDIHDDHPDLPRLAAEGRVVAYFGYGSLVNRRTLRTKFLGIRRASVAGWQRFWLPRDAAAEMALLSVKPNDAHAIDGVVVYDLADHLPSVDEREAGYARRIVDLSKLTVDGPPVADIPIYIYEAHRGAADAGDLQAAILQSYLDAVMQGFRTLYGDDGLRRFVDETEGFETRVLRDRAAPRYLRPVTLEPGESELFDRLVAARGARLIDPDPAI